MRVTKAGAKRKIEILDVALGLFSEFGYSKTSVNLILERVGISKGAFYYHFESKSAVLDELIARQIFEYKSLFKINLNGDYTALEKINIIISLLESYRYDNMERLVRFIKLINKPENMRYHELLQKRLVEEISPLLAEIMEQGIDEGSFDIDDTTITSKFLLLSSLMQRKEFARLFYTLNKDNNAIIKMNELIAFQQSFYERLLGAKKGDLIVPRFNKLKVLKAMQVIKTIENDV